MALSGYCATPSELKNEGISGELWHLDVKIELGIHPLEVAELKILHPGKKRSPNKFLAHYTLQLGTSYSKKRATDQGDRHHTQQQPRFPFSVLAVTYLSFFLREARNILVE